MAVQLLARAAVVCRAGLRAQRPRLAEERAERGAQAAPTRNGSFWKSESSQRSSASASAGSPSASPSAASTSTAIGVRNASRRDGSPGGCVAAIGSTGRIPNGRPSRVSNRTGPAASAAEVVNRIALTASAISAGASGGSAPDSSSTKQLEHAAAVGLATEARREQPTRLGPVRRELARLPEAHGRGRARARSVRATDSPMSGATTAYLPPLAEERRLEVGVRMLEGLVVPVEAAARLGGRDEQPEEHGAKQRVVLARMRARRGPARRSPLQAPAASSSRARRASSRVRRTGSRSSMNERTSGRSSYRAGPCAGRAPRTRTGAPRPPRARARARRTPRGRSREAADRDAARARARLPRTRPGRSSPPSDGATVAARPAEGRRGSPTRRAGSAPRSRRPARRRSARPRDASLRPTSDVGDERGERGTQPLGIGLAQRNERAAAALDEQHRLAVEQHDPRTGHPRSARTGSTRPRDRRAVRLGRIGGGEHEHVALVDRARRVRAKLAQPLDRTGQRELRTAETLDEVPAPADAERLERAQLAVDRAVPALDRPRRERRRA